MSQKPTVTHSATLDEPLLQKLAGEFATSLAGLQTPAVIYFEGELGAGKTTFVRAMLRTLGVTSSVKSPTYTLVETYKTESICVQHFDLYRLLDPEELEFIGLRDLVDVADLVLVEWPINGLDVLPPCDWQVTLSHAGQRRQVEIVRVAP